MQKKVLILIPALLLTYHLSHNLAHAASPKPSISPSPTASPTPSPTPISMNEVTDNLKKKLQEVLGDNETATPSTTLVRAYVGIVKDVIKDTVVIEDKEGKKDIIIKDDTTIVRTPGNATIKQDSIRIDDTIIAIGTPTDQNVLSGKRLIVSTTPFTPSNKSTGVGTIKEITKNTITLSVEDKTQELNISTKTIFKSAAGTMQLAELSEGDTIIYTATKDEDNELDASIIMRIKTSSL